MPAAGHTNRYQVTSIIKNLLGLTFQNSHFLINENDGWINMYI